MIVQFQKNNLLAFCRRCMSSFASCLCKTTCLLAALCLIAILLWIFPASTNVLTMQMTMTIIEIILDIFILNLSWSFV